MTFASSRNRVRERRKALGLTQAELASRTGISRTAVTAIEGRRLVPSVAAALSLAEALGCTVEDLFGKAPADDEVWAGRPHSDRCWRADVGGTTVLYPADSLPMFTPLPDGSIEGSPVRAQETLVIACCDPAAGILASQYAAVTGLRMLVLPRSSRQALDMLQNRLVHMAGLHLSTEDDPDRNATVVRETLGEGFRLARMAGWQEGIAVTPTAKIRSVRGAVAAKLSWIGREPGSGARQCLDRVLGNRPSPRRITSHHRGVAEIIRSGCADAGVCLQLASAEAGLDFLPVQLEAYDLCFPEALTDDRRVSALLRVIRSSPYRRLLNQLPGYDSSDTGNVWQVD
jgi:molybdate-binding protein/DNA-binding XRE family transcriptional regulator